jgi:putative transposase
MYDWRKLTIEQRREVLDARKMRRHPWHSPPHQLLQGVRQYIVSAACYEHADIIGRSAKRMDEFANELLANCEAPKDELFAWCILPNHYHVVVQTAHIGKLLRDLGLMHGRTSHRWNGEELTRGRKVWHNAVEREMRSDRHLWASINYVHHNPVKHGYVQRWQDWPWNSAASFLDAVGPERAREIWLAYPVRNYGAGWDD